MIDVSLLFIFQNIIIISFIFWALSFGGTHSYKIKHYKNNFELFECGFISFIKFSMQFNLTFLIIVWLLIIYDVEFFFLVPYIFNWWFSTPHFLFYYNSFLGVAIITLLYDYQIVYLNYYI